MSQAMVDIIVPSYNRGRFLAQLVESLNAQQHSAWRLIIVDDGSTDDTQRICRELGITSYIKKENGGPSSARNVGIDHGDAEYVAFLDTDDVWDPAFLQQGLEFISQEGLGIVVSNWREIDKEGAVVNPDYWSSQDGFERCIGWENLSSKKLVLPPQVVRNWFISHSPAPSSAWIVRRSVIKKHWRSNLRVGEDRVFFWENLLASGCRLGVMSEPCWSFRKHDANEYLNNPRHDRIAYRDNRSLDVMMQLTPDLTRPEVKKLLRAKARNYFDWAYHARMRHQPKLASILFKKSMLLHPRVIAAKAWTMANARRVFKHL